MKGNPRKGEGVKGEGKGERSKRSMSRIMTDNSEAYKFTGTVYYKKLIDRFGYQRITPELLQRIKALLPVSWPVHFLHRDFFYCHELLDYR